MSAAPEVTQRHATAANLGAALGDLRWLLAQVVDRERQWPPADNRRSLAFEPIRLVVDDALQYESEAVSLLVAAAATVGCVMLDPAHPSPGACLGVEIVIAHDPPAVALYAPERPDTPELWLSTLRYELRQAVVEGWVQLDPPWPGVTSWQQCLERERRQP